MSSFDQAWEPWWKPITAVDARQERKRMRKPNLKTASADDLVAWIRFQIRKAHGDAVENESKVIAKSHGLYDVTVGFPEPLHIGPFRRAMIQSVIDLIKLSTSADLAQGGSGAG